MLFSASITLLSAGLLTGAAVSTESLLEPFQEGVEWATERGLSRGTSALTVLVSSYDAGAIERIAGATVEVEKTSREGESVVATSTTGEDGRAVFELQSGSVFGGGYWVHVKHGSVESSTGTQLEEDVRLGLYLTPDGKGYWRTISHKDLEERGGDVARLGVRMVDDAACEHSADGKRTYCAGVDERSIHMIVHRVENGERKGVVVDEFHPQESAKGGHDPRIAPGEYDVVTTYKGASRTDRITLLCDLVVFALYDGTDELKLEHKVGCGNQAVAIIV